VDAGYSKTGAKRLASRKTAVAERLGKPPSYVAKYELGDRRLGLLEFLDVAAAIGFDPCRPIRALLPDELAPTDPRLGTSAPKPSVPI
jgi:hypothetical protein